MAGTKIHEKERIVDESYPYEIAAVFG